MASFAVPSFYQLRSTSLMLAAGRGLTNIVRELLVSGADFNQRNSVSPTDYRELLEALHSLLIVKKNSDIATCS